MFGGVNKPGMALQIVQIFRAKPAMLVQGGSPEPWQENGDSSSKDSLSEEERACYNAALGVLLEFLAAPEETPPFPPPPDNNSLIAAYIEQARARERERENSHGR